MDYSSIIEAKRSRLATLEAVMGDQNFFDDAKKAGELMREHRTLQKLLADWDAYEKAQRELAENRDMAKGGDAELAEMAAAEIPALAGGGGSGRPGRGDSGEGLGAATAHPAGGDADS